MSRTFKDLRHKVVVKDSILHLQYTATGQPVPLGYCHPCRCAKCVRNRLRRLKKERAKARRGRHKAIAESMEAV